MLIDIVTLYGEICKEKYKIKPIIVTIWDDIEDEEVQYEVTQFGMKYYNEMGIDEFSNFLNALMDMDDQYNLNKILKRI